MIKFKKLFDNYFFPVILLSLFVAAMWGEYRDNGLLGVIIILTIGILLALVMFPGMRWLFHHGRRKTK